MLSQLNEVAYRSAGPDDVHLGALLSPGFPQDFSHFDAFSWLTSRPDSSSVLHNLISCVTLGDTAGQRWHTSNVSAV